MNKAVWIIIIILILAGGWWWWSENKTGEEGAMKEENGEMMEEEGAMMEGGASGTVEQGAPLNAEVDAMVQ